MLVMGVIVTLSMRVQTIFGDLSFRWLLWLLCWLLYLRGKIHDYGSRSSI